MIHLLMITIILVYVIDYTNGAEEVFNYILKQFWGSKCPYIELSKPFGCSMCMTLYITFLYQWNISVESIFYSCMFSYSTTYILFIFNIVDSTITKIYRYLDERIR